MTTCHCHSCEKRETCYQFQTAYYTGAKRALNLLGDWIENHEDSIRMYRTNTIKFFIPLLGVFLRNTEKFLREGGDFQVSFRKEKTKKGTEYIVAEAKGEGRTGRMDEVAEFNEKIRENRFLERGKSNMTTEQTALQRLKEVCEKATPGPWMVDKYISGYAADIWPINAEGIDILDAEFIASARTSLPALIEYCESLEQLTALVEPVKEFVYLVKTQYSAATAAVEAARARLEEACPK